MLHLSEQTISLHLSHAATLTNSYHDTLASLASGAISVKHTNVIVDAGHIIDTPGQADTAEVAANRAAYEVQVLVHAVTVTPAQLKPIARRIAEAYAHEDLDTRYERAKKDRKVWVTEREDGLAELCALLPAHKAKAAYSRLTQMSKRGRSVDSGIMRQAKELQDKLIAGSSAGADTCAPVNAGLWVPFSPLATQLPGRTMDEFRADLLSDLLLNGTGDTATGSDGTGIAGIVQIITHVIHLEDPTSSLNGSSDTAGDIGMDAGTDDYTEQALPEMEGYGPIPVSMARDIAAEGGTWSDISVNLGTGTVLTVENYRPSEAIRRFLAARDQHCRFPGCRAPVHRCDFDHTVDAALGGSTSTSNLGALCRGHHILKHHSGWDVIQQLNGDYDWTSPTGRATTDKPLSRVLFRPVKTPRVDRPGAKPEGRALSTLRAEGTAPSTGSSGELRHPF